MSSAGTEELRRSRLPLEEGFSEALGQVSHRLDRADEVAKKSIGQAQLSGTTSETESSGPRSAWRSKFGNFLMLRRFFARLSGAAGKFSDSGHGKPDIEAIC